MMNVFVCYGNDGHLINIFASQLEMLGYVVAYENEPSDKKEHHIQILKYIRECDAFIIPITQQMNVKVKAGAGKSNEQVKDIRPDTTQMLYALDLGKTVVPVLLEESDLKWFPDFLKPLTPIHYYKPEVQSSDALTQALSTSAQVLPSGLYLSSSDQAWLKHNLKTDLNEPYRRKELKQSFGAMGTDLAASEDPIHPKYIKQLLGERPPDEAVFTCQADQLSERSFTCHTIVTSVAFSPDGCYVFARTGDGLVRMWNAITGQEILQKYIYPYPSFTFYSNDQWTYLTPWEYEVAVVNSVSGRSGFKYVGHWDFTTAAAFSPDNQLVATASQDRTARIFQAKGESLHLLLGHTDAVTSVVFSPDGNYLLTGSEDHSARIWGVHTGQEIKQFVGHNSHVSSAVFSPDGRFILTGSFDHTVVISEAGIT